MQQAFKILQHGKHDEASNMFKVIANAESQKWLRYYYMAYINVVSSFAERNEKKIGAKL